jgi:hypothetical protein
MAIPLKKLLMRSFADALVTEGRIKGATNEAINAEVRKIQTELDLKDGDFVYLAYLVRRKLNAASKPVASTRPH